MKLNYDNAKSAELLQGGIRQGRPAGPIVHFGVGGFHRAHQAWALQRLKKAAPEKYAKWGITGVCIMDGDLAFVEAMRRQDCLYYTQSFAPDGQSETVLVSVLSELLFAKQDYPVILDRIAAPETKVVSFTITEGGYNVDYDNHSFIWSAPAVLSDLNRLGTPKTIYRFLAEGLRKRMDGGIGGLVLMSCDNVQHNGDILRFALLEFLSRFDPALTAWVEAEVSFVKTMVDRITPATTREQKTAFAKAHPLEDDCLVVCEDFFQWVIQKDRKLDGLPYTAMGAMLVDDVAPYEKMKLRLLNGGHSLVGLLGELLGYDRIHTSISDPLIRAVYKQYAENEVMDTLDIIPGMDYHQYTRQLIERFSNPMINDSTARIISGSNDKLPKFVIPVLSDQLERTDQQVKWAVFILALWYAHLTEAYQKDQFAGLAELNKEELAAVFGRPEFGPSLFLREVEALRPIKDVSVVQSLFSDYTTHLMDRDYERKRNFIEQLIEKDH